MKGIFSRLGAAFRGLVHVLSRPVRRAQGGGGIVIEPYRGYGNRGRVLLMGRVLYQSGRGRSRSGGGLAADLLDVGRLMLRRGVPEAVVAARFCGATDEVEADRDGYFQIELHPEETPPDDRLWHEVHLETVRPPGASATAHLFVPPSSARFVVISDIDDTVMYTGVANKLKMLWRLFVQGAESRVAFPGVASLYAALHRGASGHAENPLLYVSRGPWSIYGMLETFFQHHDIPVGPILFLREWGLTLQHPLPRRSEGHKKALIEDMLAVYDELPFVLVGDSGQHDPEIYAAIVREHPGRVLAIYIRNVSRSSARRETIEALAEEVAAAGSSLVLAADSFAMAEHAAAHDLISAEAKAEVLAERAQQQDDVALRPRRDVEAPTPRATRDAVRRGAVDAALDEDAPEETPPNVVVEPEEREDPREGAGRGSADPD